MEIANVPPILTTLMNKLMVLKETNVCGQKKLVMELFFEFNKFTEDEQCDSILEILSYNVPMGGVMYEGMFMLRTISALFNIAQDITTRLKWPLIMHEFDALFHNVLFLSKKKNKYPLIKIRKQLGKILPINCFSNMDEKGKRRYGSEWHFNQDLQNIISPRPTSVLNDAMQTSSPNHYQHENNSSSTIYNSTDSLPSVFNIEENELSDNQIVIYQDSDHSDPDDIIIPPKKAKHIDMNDSSYSNMEDFLMSCREESVRIRTETVKIPKPILNIFPSSPENNNIPKQIDDTQNEARRDKETEVIRKRTINEISLSSSASPSKVSSSNKNKSCESFKDPHSSKGWTPSMIPSKPVRQIEPIITKESKIFQDIKRKLQNTKVQPNLAVTVDGNVREVLLPVNFTAEEYVDHILSSSFQSHGLKMLNGKYVVYVAHRLNP